MKKIICNIGAVMVAFLLLSFQIEPKNEPIKVGDKLPVFTLKDENNITFCTQKLKGNPAIIYFYPKDNTSVCTAEACTFRDEFAKFKNLNVQIVGISADSPESHKEFKKKYNLPFTLLSDSDWIAHKYFFGDDSQGFKRVTFVIDAKGIVKYIFEDKANAKSHIENSLRELQKIK